MNISFSVGDETRSDALPSIKTVPLLASRGSPKLFSVPIIVSGGIGIKTMMFRCSRRLASVSEVTSFREEHRRKEHRHSLLPPFPAAQGGLDSFYLL